MQNLVELIKTLRSYPTELEYVEFKRGYSEAEKEGRDIAALANAAAYHGVPAAYKIWGIDDATHEVVGTDFNPKTKKKGNQDLEPWLRQHLTPNAHFEFSDTEVDGNKLVVLKVWPAFGQPVEFDGAPYIRTGTSTQRLPYSSTRGVELWQRVQREVFEDQLAAEDLRPAEVLERLEVAAYFDMLGMMLPDSQETLLHYLGKESMIRRQANGLYAITNLGALLFARDFDLFPTIKRKAPRVIQYQGTSRMSMTREQSFTRGYAVGFNELFNYVMALVPSLEVIEGALRVSTSKYPRIAVRELLANALIHQDLRLSGVSPMVEVFDDRIEIANPGGPMVDVYRLVNDPPRSRNEKLSALMRRLGVCEEAGTGWDKVISACEAAHLPAPRIEAREDVSMRVVLHGATPFRSLTKKERLDACYWHACICYASGTYATNASLRERFDLSASASAQVSRLIKDALAENLIKPVDPDTAPRYMRYEPAWA